jgi:porphobilinogen synthase
METNFRPLTHRRLRTDAHMRELTASVKLSHKNFIQPLFVDEALPLPRRVNGLNDVQVDTINSVLTRIEEDVREGATKFLLFPVPGQRKDSNFDFSFSTSIVSKIKEQFGDRIWLAADVCLCSYTTHGHCGILSEDQSQLLNNETIESLSCYAGLLANAGVDCIAPSDMTDGRIGAIRKKLNSLGYEHVSIMSYAAKFSSQFYGPFRDACHSAPKASTLRDRKTYQLSPYNINDALNSALRDEKEGADILMVKPATLYGDVISKLRQQTLKPIAAYHVSGEYAAIEALAEKDLLDREAAHLEAWVAMQRSGADIIISYAARYAKKWIDNASI